MGREVTQLDLGLWSGSTLPSLRSRNGRRRARRARGGRSLLPVAGLPGFRGDLPEWSYQQVISRERNARPSRRRSNSFATARQHPSSIVGRAGNCALALPHQQSDVCDVEDGGEDAKARMNGSLPEDERWSVCRATSCPKQARHKLTRNNRRRSIASVNPGHNQIVRVNCRLVLGSNLIVGLLIANSRPAEMKLNPCSRILNPSRSTKKLRRS